MARGRVVVVDHDLLQSHWLLARWWQVPYCGCGGSLPLLPPSLAHQRVLPQQQQQQQLPKRQQKQQQTKHQQSQLTACRLSWQSQGRHGLRCLLVARASRCMPWKSVHAPSRALAIHSLYLYMVARPSKTQSTGARCLPALRRLAARLLWTCRVMASHRLPARSRWPSCSMSSMPSALLNLQQSATSSLLVDRGVAVSSCNH